MTMHWPPSRFISGGRRTDGGLSLTFFLTALLMSACIVLGGASRLNVVQVAILELASLPILGLALLRVTRSGRWSAIKTPAMLLAAAALLPLLQLIPIPYGLWAALPGHDAAAEALNASGLAGGWRSISLTPYASLSSSLFVLPPAALFFGASCLPDAERRGLVAVLLLCITLSLAIGVTQVVLGPGNRLYFYDGPKSFAIGLFSNRNHQAVLLVLALPLAALWVSAGRHGRRTSDTLATAAAVALTLAVVVGLVMVRSRAGIALLIPSLGASALILWGRQERSNRYKGAIIAGLTAVVVLAGVLGAKPIIERFGGGALTELRLQALPVIAKAAVDHMPLGAGMGAFVPVYNSVEPIELMGPPFLNHAHNEYLEIALEAGVPGLFLLAAFLFWWIRNAILAWRAPATPRDDLIKAASVITGMLLLHSLLDYPLRTLGLAGVFAIGCGFMTHVRPSAVRPRTAPPVS